MVYCAHLAAANDLGILYLDGYDLKGLCALEEYYARELGAYYAALTLGPSHNDYLGRAEANITPWVRYFIAGMAHAFEKVRDQAITESTRGGIDRSKLLRALDAKQRKALTRFEPGHAITAKDIAKLFGYRVELDSLILACRSVRRCAECHSTLPERV